MVALMGKSSWPPELRAAPRGTCGVCDGETRAWGATWRVRCRACWGLIPRSPLSDAAMLVLYRVLVRRKKGKAR